MSKIWHEEGVLGYLVDQVRLKLKPRSDLSYAKIADRMNVRFAELIEEKYPNGFTPNMVLAKVRNSDLVPAGKSTGKARRTYTPREASQSSGNNSTVSRTRNVRDVTDTDVLAEMLTAHGFDEIPGVLKLSLTDLMKYELNEGIICCQYAVSESIQISNAEQLYCGIEIAKEGREKSLKSRYCPAHRVRAFRGLNHSGKKIIPAENITSLEQYLVGWKAKAEVIAKEWRVFAEALASFDLSLLSDGVIKSPKQRKAALK
jgi:hypothetical protein